MPISTEATMENLRVEVARLQGKVDDLQELCLLLEWRAVAETALVQGLVLQLDVQDVLESDALLSVLRMRANQVANEAARFWILQSVDALDEALHGSAPTSGVH